MITIILTYLAILMQPVDVNIELVEDSLGMCFVFTESSGSRHDLGEPAPAGTVIPMHEVGDTWEDGGGRFSMRYDSAGLVADTLIYTLTSPSGDLDIHPGLLVLNEDSIRALHPREFYNDRYNDFGIMVNDHFYVRLDEPSPWHETPSGRTKRTLWILACGLAVGTIAGIAIKWR